MNLIDKENAAARHICKKTGKITRFFDHGTAGGFYFGAHRVADDVGKRGLAKSRRAAEQDVVKDVFAFFCGFDEQLQAFAHTILPHEFLKHRRPQ